MPPLWALAAIVVLGMNEFLVILYNPLWLLLLILLFLFGKTVYQELDIDGELQAGLLPGLLSISVKLWPTLTQVWRLTFDECTSKDHCACFLIARLFQTTDKQTACKVIAMQHVAQNETLIPLLIFRLCICCIP